MSSDDDPKDLTKDIVQIGVNEEIAEKLQNMMDDLDPQWFSSMQDIYKFAVAVAIAKELKPDMKAPCVSKKSSFVDWPKRSPWQAA